MRPGRLQILTLLMGSVLAVPFPAAAERECRPDPVYLNIDYTSASLGDAHLYLSPSRDFRQHRWGETELMRPFSKLHQVQLGSDRIQHGLPGVSIKLRPRSVPGGDYFEFPAVHIKPDRTYPAACIYHLGGAPTRATVLRLPRQSRARCENPETYNVLGKEVYKSSILKACHGRINHGTEITLNKKINLGTISINFSDNFMMFHTYFVPGALTSFTASLFNDNIAGGGVTLTDMLNAAGGYVYRVTLDMSHEHERNER